MISLSNTYHRRKALHRRHIEHVQDYMIMQLEDTGPEQSALQACITTETGPQQMMQQILCHCTVLFVVDARLLGLVPSTI